MDDALYFETLMSHDELCDDCHTRPATDLIGIGWYDDFDAPKVAYLCGICAEKADEDPAVTQAAIRRMLG